MSSPSPVWPGAVPASRLRIVRPTQAFTEMVDFYTAGVGLQVLEAFENHYGYDGVMIGLPGEGHHLEIVVRDTPDAEPNPCPNLDNLLVLYFDAAHADAIGTIADRLEAMGYPRSPAINEWWNVHGGVQILDPDGWPLMLYPMGGS